VLETRFAEGDTANLGDVLVVIDTEGGPESEWFGIVGSPPAESHGRVRDGVSAGRENRVRAAPLVRRMARDRGIDLTRVHGSGPGGRVRIADLESAARQARPELPAELPRTAEPTGVRVVPLAGLRKSIADHMVQAWRNAPQVTCMDLMDAAELVRARSILQARPEPDAPRLTYLPFFVKCAIEALKAVPESNATVDDQRQAVLVSEQHHIGIATAVPGGLLVPVVRHADQLTLFDLAREIERLVAAARERRALPAELSGSTFTITSFGGMPGSALFATPVLNYPEVAILGLGRIEPQARVVDGQVVPRPCIGVSLTFDHRVLDGEAAGKFMATFRRFLEQPLELLARLR
jgi:pyruvate dehydrogenase E2 component (dihydrolipoamide acetyltransferase)